MELWKHTKASSCSPWVVAAARDGFWVAMVSALLSWRAGFSLGKRDSIESRQGETSEPYVPIFLAFDAGICREGTL